MAAPDKDIAGENDAGRVYLLRNDADLLRPVAGGILQQSSFGFGSEAGDRFGAALAAGYIDGDRFEDLVVGVPGEETTATPVSNEGFVAVIFGSASGLTTGSTYIHFREPDLGGVSTANANFGSVLAVSDLNRDGLDEIIIGVPTRDVDGENNAGIVYIRRPPGASGMDVLLNNTAFSNTAQTPVASGTSQTRVSATGTLFAGPVEHSEFMELEIDVSANGVVNDLAGGSGWRCVNTTFSSGREGKRCRLDEQTVLGATTPLRPFRLALKPGSSNGEVQWQVRLRGDATDTVPSNNQASGSMFFIVSTTLFANGFEQ